MRHIWFIRHGESEANAGLPTSDPDTIALTRKGERQAELVANEFKTQPDRIIYSPFSRTLATAQPTIQRYPSVPCEQWPIHEFTYLSPTRCVNTTIAERRPWVDEYWQRSDPHFVDGDGAEAFADLSGRVSQMFESLKESPPDAFYAAFTHGMFMNAILFSVMTDFSPVTAQSMALFKKLMETSPVPNCAILKCIITDDGQVYVSSLSLDHLV